MTHSLSTILMIGLGSMSLAGENWPQWRGPDNDGHAEAKNIPTKFDANTNILWKAPLPGPGASTPCIWGDKIFLTAQEGEKLVLLCFNTQGQQLWKQLMGSGEARFRGDEGNLASASPSTDGKRVIAFVGTGTLAAYTLEGKPIWSIDLQEKYGEFQIQFGAHWTPVLYKDRVYMQMFHRGTQSLLAFDATSGKELWRVERKGAGVGESPDTYASCFVYEGDGGPLLIAHGNDYTTAHRLKDGSEIWRVGDLNPTGNRTWRFVSSPLVAKDLIVIPSCKNGPTVAIDPSKAKGTINAGNPAEYWRIQRITPDVPSPLLVGDHVYLMGANGELLVLQEKTGDEVFNERITNERHRSNPLLVDGKVYLVGRDGSVVVVKPGEVPTILAKNKLPDNFTASPAVAGNVLYLRGWKYLWAIGTK